MLRLSEYIDVKLFKTSLLILSGICSVETLGLLHLCCCLWLPIITFYIHETVFPAV